MYLIFLSNNKHQWQAAVSFDNILDPVKFATSEEAERQAHNLMTDGDWLFAEVRNEDDDVISSIDTLNDEV